MRYIHKISIALGALVALAACQRDIVPQPDVLGGEGIVLKLETSELDLQTKAGTRPGNDDGRDFNENSLGSAVDIFFFPENSADNAPSVKNLRKDIEAGGRVEIPVSMSEIYTIFGSTAAGSKADVFVVANYDGAAAIDHSRHYTLSELKNLQLKKAVWSTFPQEYFVMTGKASITLTDPSGNTPAAGEVKLRRIASKLSFKMTVASEIVVENTTRDANGEVVERSLDRWTPVEDAMTVYLQYGMNYARLGGQALKVPADSKGAGATDSLFTYEANKLVKTTATKERHRTIIDALEKIQTGVDADGKPVYTWNLETHEADVAVPVYETRYGTDTGKMGPFYSYPVTWAPGVQTEPFLKLIIPWNNGSRTKYYYYKIPFSGTSLEANNWYEITLDVQVLGGEDATPVPLAASYKVVDWVEGTEAQTETVAARYLSVPRTEWIMYNQDSLEIPITSSHDVQIVGYSVKNGAPTNDPRAAGYAFTAGDKALDASWIGNDPRIYNPFTETRFSIDGTTTVGTVYATSVNYNQTGMNGAPYPDNVPGAASWFVESGITRDGIEMKHDLNNDMSGDDYDVAPYFIRIRVQHKDDPTNYYRDIIIEQRPAIMIDAEFNSGGTSSTGYVYVNDGEGSLGTNGSSNASGNNTNDYMYIITTTVLPTTGSLSKYVLGDPRSLTVDNLYSVNGSGSWSSANSSYVGGGNSTRRLSNYYPSIMDATGDNIIAPKIRIASSHGKTSTLSYANALRRCATYQEDGYPAGRWRVPTQAEIMYMAQLNTDKKIPRLLGVTTGNSTATTDYWCNSGYVTVASGSNTASPVYNSGKTGNRYVRCVYDEWFWENTTHATVDKTTFTWGDEKREDVVRTKALY